MRNLTINVDKQTKRLLAFLDSYRTADGAYYGWVVHRYNLKRLHYIHDTPWEQSSVICGLINLYKVTTNDKYYRKAKESVMLQMTRIVQEEGHYINAGFEDDRFSSLVHNSMADCALLRFLSIIKPEDKALYSDIIETAKLNIDKYILGELYNPEVHACRFSRVDYYAPKKIRYVANMNSVAVTALLLLYDYTQDEHYYDIAKTITDWIKTQIVFEEGVLNGAISYSNTENRWFVGIYTALALDGICEMYERTNDPELKRIMLATSKHLQRYTEDGYFYHAHIDDKIQKYPYFLAGAGIILKEVDTVEKLLNIDILEEKYLINILNHQLSNGGVSSFSHYNAKSNYRNKFGCKPTTLVWEDYTPCPAWNAQLFEYLSRHITKDFDRVNVKNSSVFKVSKTFAYGETRKRFGVISFWPPYSAGIIIIKKIRNFNPVAFSFDRAYRFVQRKIRK